MVSSKKNRRRERRLANSIALWRSWPKIVTLTTVRRPLIGIFSLQICSMRIYNANNCETLSNLKRLSVLRLTWINGGIRLTTQGCKCDPTIQSIPRRECAEQKLNQSRSKRPLAKLWIKLDTNSSSSFL